VCGNGSLCQGGKCAAPCQAGFGDCDGNCKNGCETNLKTDVSNCGGCGIQCRFSHASAMCLNGMSCGLTACDAGYVDCDGNPNNGCEALGSALGCPAASCLAILDAGVAMGDGLYWIKDNQGLPVQVRCLHSADGGGWTLVANFPWPGNTNGVAGWNSGSRVGNTYTDLATQWKMSDSFMNSLRTKGWRVRGTATVCWDGPCMVDSTYYFAPTCTYNSAALNPSCGQAYYDAAMQQPSQNNDGTACGWHWGLTSASCGGVAEVGTSHMDNHEFIGIYKSSSHAYDGRAGENPSLQTWVR
jgi:hypothetical protein